MKSRNLFLIMITISLIGGAIMLMGIIWVTDGDTKYDYEGKTFLLQDYMSQQEQSTLGLTMFLLGIVVLLSPLTYPWLWVAKKVCVNCNKNKTRNRNENKIAICEDCEEAICNEGLVKKAKDEKILSCPVDGSEMHKLVLNGTKIVVDQCPTCKGTWLDQSETAELEEDLGQPSSAGSFSSGMVLGMNIGRMS